MAFFRWCGKGVLGLEEDKRKERNHRYYVSKKKIDLDDEKKKIDKRSQYWSFIVYPESAPDNWKEILDDLVIPWVCSPLHDKDEVIIDGVKKPKKEHWHIIMKTGKKSYRQVKEFSDLVCGAPPVAVQDPAAMTRYLIHMDHENKYQYDKKDIECHCGYDCKDWLGLTSRQQLKLLSDMITLCREQEIDEFTDLYFWAMDNDQEWWEYISMHIYQVKTILHSWHQMRKEKEKIENY